MKKEIVFWSTLAALCFIGLGFSYKTESPIVSEWPVWAAFIAVFAFAYFGCTLTNARVRRAQVKPTLIVQPLEPASRSLE